MLVSPSVTTCHPPPSKNLKQCRVTAVAAHICEMGRCQFGVWRGCLVFVARVAVCVSWAASANAAVCDGKVPVPVPVPVEYVYLRGGCKQGSSLKSKPQSFSSHQPTAKASGFGGLCACNSQAQSKTRSAVKGRTVTTCSTVFLVETLSEGRRKPWTKNLMSAATNDEATFIANSRCRTPLFSQEPAECLTSM